MITIVDEEAGEVVVRSGGSETRYPLTSPEGFHAISRAWVQVSWQVKYAYSFSWFGRPVIQLPEDMIRIQEVLYRIKPDVLIETGVAHGGSLIFYASLFRAMGKGRVIGIDVEIRRHNREAIEAHEFSPLITLIEGSSTAPDIVARVKALVKPGEKVMAILDSAHTKEHVLNELRAYSPLIAVDSYIVATDGIIEQFAGLPRSQPDWTWNNPKEAALEFARGNPDFAVEEPVFPFNEGKIEKRITYWPSAYIRRVK